MSKNKYEAFSREAQKKLREHRMCLRKVSFDSPEDAAETGNASYLCPYCNKWHTTASLQKLIHKVNKRK